MANWQIEILNPSLGGYAPAFYNETYPSYGNKNNAGAMSNMDLTNAGFMTQGPGLTTFTNGTEAGAVTTLIKSIYYKGTNAFVAGIPAVGGDKFYLFSSATNVVNSGGTYPHTIDKGGVTGEDAEDVAIYAGDVYYTYNYTGAGDIGKYDTSSFDDDWGSTVPTGAGTLTTGSPHQIAVGGNNVMYIANNQYVTSYNGTALVIQALDLPFRSVVASIVWYQDRLWIFSNKGSSGATNEEIDSSIYVWDGTTDSWEFEIKPQGKLGGAYVKGGVLYFFYQDTTSTGGYKLAYVNGTQIVDITNFTGGLPAYYQISTFKDFLVWVAGSVLWAYGSGHKDIPARLFQYADGGYSTVGGVGVIYGNFAVASNQSSSYKVAYLSNYDTSSNWKSIMFDITGSGKVSKIDAVRINHETLATGARVDWKLLNNKGETIYTDHISYDSANTTKTTAYYPLNGKVAENFRVEFDYASGSTSNPVKIKNCKVYGTYS